MTNKTQPVLFATITQTVGTTAWPTNLGGELFSSYSHVDLVCVVNTISGVTSTAGVTVNLQEYFPSSNNKDVGQYFTTARIVDITKTGAFYATYDDNNAQAATPYATPGTVKNAMLGKGQLKQIVTTAGAVNTFNMDVILCFWNP